MCDATIGPLFDALAQWQGNPEIFGLICAALSRDHVFCLAELLRPHAVSLI